MADYTFGIGEELQFATQDTDLIHTWNFGDGATSTLPNPSHIYTAQETYTVTHTARDFCDTCVTIGSHTVEITLASITVKSILLDKYDARVGDIITITTIAQNLSSVFGTSTISINFGGDILGPYNVTLAPGQETSFVVQHQVRRSGIIDIYADNVYTVLFVESMISVKSVTVNPPISTGQAIMTTVEVKNEGTFSEDKDISITLTNAQTVSIDTTRISLAPGGTQTYTKPIDVRALSLPNGTYTVCANGMCKAISVAIAPDVGSLNIVSVPDRAEVWIDSQDRGITNTTITDILAGNHSFTLILNGYNNTTGTITIVGGMTSYIYVSLVPTEPTTGSIAISSTPTGADIYLGGNQVFDTNNQPLRTPATLSGIAPGFHIITLKLSGYEDYNTPSGSPIEVIAGQTAYLSVSLLQSPILVGSINFTSVPDGAEIIVGGSPTGKTTPNTVTGKAIGTYSFILRLIGYNDVIGQIDVVGGITSYVYAVMVPISPLTGSLSISSSPQGADIYLGGVQQLDVNNQPLKTPATIQNLAPKPTAPGGTGYTITIKKKDYQDFSATVSVVAGQTTYLGVTLQRIQIISAGIPWWLVAGLAVGMYLTGKKEEEKGTTDVQKKLTETRKELTETREELMAVPKKPLTEEDKYLVAKLRKKGIVGTPICTGETCRIRKWRAIAGSKGQEPIIIQDS